MRSTVPFTTSPTLGGGGGALTGRGGAATGSGRGTSAFTLSEMRVPFLASSSILRTCTWTLSPCRSRSPGFETRSQASSETWTSPSMPPMSTKAP